MKIPGVDIMEGLSHANDDMELYEELLQIYYEDSLDMLGELKKNPQYTDMKLFITHTHAMKSASLNIGAVEVSKMFKEMEFAGRDNDMDKIEQNFPACIATLEELQKNLQNYLENGDSGEDDGTPDVIFVNRMLSALDDMDTDTFDEMLEQALEADYNDDVNEQFLRIQSAYDDFDFAGVSDLLKELLE